LVDFVIGYVFLAVGVTVDSGEMIWVLRGYGGFVVGFVVFFFFFF
jgi:hypothetical protein